MVRVRRELDLAVELGFGGIRTEWGAKELLSVDPDGVGFMSPWAKDKVIGPYLQEIKARNLWLHITFGASKLTAEKERVFYSYVMAESYRVLGSKVSWSVANEPDAIWNRRLDSYQSERGRLLVQLWDAMGARDRGSWLYSFSFPGWYSFDFSRRHYLSYEASERIARIRWAYSEPSFKQGYLQRTGICMSFYIPGHNYDAAIYTEDMLGGLLSVIRRDIISHPFGITELNVRAEEWASEDLRGRRCAAAAKEALKTEARFVSVYCLAAVKGYDFMSGAGERNEQRIKAWKEAMR